MDTSVYTDEPTYFKVLATNLDSNGNAFASIVESVRETMWGFQFQPEKPIGGKDKT